MSSRPTQIRQRQSLHKFRAVPTAPAQNDSSPRGHSLFHDRHDIGANKANQQTDRFDGLNYKELQKLAKKHGIKANLSSEAIKIQLRSNTPIPSTVKPDRFDGLNYKELQKLAKTHGIKANLSAEAIKIQLRSNTPIPSPPPPTPKPKESHGDDLSKSPASDRIDLIKWGAMGASNLLGKAATSATNIVREQGKQHCGKDSTSYRCKCYNNPKLCTVGVIGMIGGVGLGLAGAAAVLSFMYAHSVVIFASGAILAAVGAGFYQYYLKLLKAKRLQLKVVTQLADIYKTTKKVMGNEEYIRKLKQRAAEAKQKLLHAKLEQDAESKKALSKLVTSYNDNNQTTWQLMDEQNTVLLIDPDLESDGAPNPNDPLAMRLGRTEGTSFLDLDSIETMVDLIPHVSDLIDQATTEYNEAVTEYSGLIAQAEYVSASEKYKGEVEYYALEALGSPPSKTVLKDHASKLRPEIHTILQSHQTIGTLIKVRNNLKNYRNWAKHKLKLSKLLLTVADKAQATIQSAESELEDSKSKGIPSNTVEAKLAKWTQIKLAVELIQGFLPMVSTTYNAADLISKIDLLNKVNEGQARPKLLNEWCDELEAKSEIESN